ncbi:MAG: D-cysteine desulfhydrase family protein [Candidatus Sumerlaeaceae bacterium]|nr:D-cysteine desulfhydrase family protein [Candidatus Sumerlaeaceae bacterium]
MIRHPRRIRLAHLPTPLEPLTRLSRELGGPEIWIKRDDMTGTLLSGNKVRKLEFALAEGVARQAKVIITVGGIQSNHCRATAFACARLGLECHLILRGSQPGPPDGNYLLDHLAGARFTHLPAEVYSTRRPEVVAELTEHYARQGKKAYYIPVGASNAIGAWGYVRAYEELLVQCRKRGFVPDHVVSATGSGGTTAGLLAGATLPGHHRARIYGVIVCDDIPTFERDIRAILEEMARRWHLGLEPDQIPIQLLDGYIGEGYAVPYEAELETIRLLARTEGHLLDPVYTGKAFYGLVEEIRKGRFRKTDKIVFVHTGGMFGVFPQRAAFGFPEAPLACDPQQPEAKR